MSRKRCEASTLGVRHPTEEPNGSENRFVRPADAAIVKKEYKTTARKRQAGLESAGPLFRRKTTVKKCCRDYRILCPAAAHFRRRDA